MPILPNETDYRSTTGDALINRVRQPACRSVRRSLRQWLLILVAGVIVAGLIFGGWLTWKLADTSHRISIGNVQPDSSWQALGGLAGAIFDPGTARPLRMDADGRINILLLGIAGEHQPGNYLTDTIMVLRVDTKTGKLALLSIPRDLYTNIPDTQSYTKINALYPIGRDQNQGVDLTKRAIKTITGLDIHYFLIADFAAFQQVIDALGGVSVDVARDIHDTRYPGPNYSYETFTLATGRQTLDGATALKYVRERHDDPDGDFGRAKRQQQVIQAAREQAFSLKTFVNPFAINRLLDSLGDNVTTDINPEDMPAFIELAKRVDIHNVSTAVVDAWKPESLLHVSHVQIGAVAMFILVPRVGNWSEVHDLAADLFDLDLLRRHQKAIAEESPKITIINRSGHPDYGTRLVRLVHDQLGFDSVTLAGSDIPSDASNLVDQTHGQKPWSLDSLIKKLPLTLDIAPLSATVRIPTDTDIVLIAGKNMENLFHYAEDSREDYQKSSADTNYETLIVNPGN